MYLTLYRKEVEFNIICYLIFVYGNQLHKKMNFYNHYCIIHVYGNIMLLLKGEWRNGSSPKLSLLDNYRKLKKSICTDALAVANLLTLNFDWPIHTRNYYKVVY